MANVNIPFGRETGMGKLEPAENEVVLYAEQLKVGMVVVATDYIYRKGGYFLRHYCPDEPLESTRPSEWCEIVYIYSTYYPGCETDVGRSVITFVGKHRDDTLVKYQFLLAKDTTNFIVKRDSIV